MMAVDYSCALKNSVRAVALHFWVPTDWHAVVAVELVVEEKSQQLRR